ncbi:hypothetical protein KFU94_32015 [Chloroflexi bacterium TSY]|nr:hypothetical protein [Chloroflexi bacterium TSY]
MSSNRSELQKKATSELIQYAIFRWESAIIIALTIILTFLLRKPFPWWPIWGWPLLGLIGLGAIVYTSLTDQENNAQVLLDTFQGQFNLRTIRDRELRSEVQSALEYQRRIDQKIREQNKGIMRDRLENTADKVNDWITNVYQLALRLDAYRKDDLLSSERQALPQDVQKFTARRKLETNEIVQNQLDEVIDSKVKQWESLRALDARMKQAELQLDQSVTALATIYSQIQLVDAQDVGSGRAERLQNDIQEQVNRLNDLVSSINDVYNYQTHGLG